MPVPTEVGGCWSPATGVSCHVVPGIKPSPYKSDECSQSLSHLSSPQQVFLNPRKEKSFGVPGEDLGSLAGAHSTQSQPGEGVAGPGACWLNSTERLSSVVLSDRKPPTASKIIQFPSSIAGRGLPWPSCSNFLLGLSLPRTLYPSSRMHIKASGPQGSLGGIYFCIFMEGRREDNLIHNVNCLAVISILPPFSQGDFAGH